MQEEQSKAAESGRQRRSRRERGNLLGYVLADVLKASLALMLLQGFVFHFSVVRGRSMEPNIADGDRLLVDRVSYALGDVQRFDVVILASPEDPGVDYVKRVVGLPGDRVDLIGGRVRINGEYLEPGLSTVPDPEAFGTWKVPEQHYFVLGDNRPVSSDSREGWFVPMSQLRGKVQFCIWPLSHVGSL
ncbi:MAG: signal peptidase I [Planctomycetota bacterium]|nr:MAG: signal peptidase I [Planctomycetota bacterium]